MFALISPNEKTGAYQRIAELADVPFDVSEPLRWVDAPAGTTTEGHAYDPVSNTIVAYAPNPEPEAISTEVTMRQARLDSIS